MLWHAVAEWNTQDATKFLNYTVSGGKLWGS